MRSFTSLILQIAVSLVASVSVVGAAEIPYGDDSLSLFSTAPESLIQSQAFGDHKNDLRQVDFSSCELGVISASDSPLPNAFGEAVAISGNVIVIGAPRESHAGTASGAVYVYERTGASWTTETKLLAADTVGGDQFGFAVAVSGDWIAVGAPFDDDLGSLSGAVYLFYREITGWSPVEKLLPADGMSQDRFGYSLALEDNRLVVGAIGKPGGSFAGAAYVFDYVGGAWIQQTQFTGNGVGGNDYFGDSLAIEGDLIAVGASEDNALYQYDPPGKCYLFRRNGSAWIQEASLSPNGGGLNDRFGASVTINGGMVVVGSPYDDGAALNTGSAYVFRKPGSTWVQEARLVPTDELFFAQLGQSVAAYGNLILLGAGGHDLLGDGAGAAFLFRWTNGHWFEELSFFHPTSIEYPQFGNAISLDAGIAVIGAPSLAAGGLGPGFAVVYDLLPGTDCDQDGVNDACEPDCNSNNIGDECDIAAGTSVDCNNNRVPDECEPDCNANQQTDECDVVAGTSGDCNSNLIPDECELDCNANAVPDSCDIDLFGAADCNSNRIPDECETDCNLNSVPDECDLDDAFSPDCNSNSVPDECDAGFTSVDCNLNSVPDECEVDCNQNEIPDECDISAGTSGDCTGNGVPDDCEPDCNQNSQGDSCDILSGYSDDLDANGYPDECQQTRCVPSQYATIQSAVDAAQNGDTVLIANGTYSGYGNYNISVWGKEIIIRSENGPALCVLDVQDAGRGVSYFYGYRPYKARLEGLTIRHGRAAIGGAVFCDRLTQIEIRHCVLQANDATNYDHAGGAVFARPTSTVSLEHCTIAENFTFGLGAAVYCELCELAVSNCLFEDNIANGSGGAIYQEGGVASILNSLFSGNVTRGPNGRDNRGSGISAWEGAQVEVRGCTFANNRSTIGTVFSSDDSQTSLSNCVFWDNRSFHPLVGTALTATFSNVQGGWPGNGNLDLDPVFFNPGSGDYRLAPVSPCINAGDPAFLSSAGEKDIDNQSRVHRHRVDIGADEYYPYDCDKSGSDDFIDIDKGVSPDCNSNFVPDHCDLLLGLDVDQIPGFGDLIPDSCQPDCNGNGVLDSVELDLGIGFDCDSNGVLDECTGKFPATVRLADMDAVSGLTVLGLSAANYMGQVAGDTDFNGDGWNDLIIGAPGASPGGLPFAGECYVLFGPIDPLENQSIDLDSLDGQKGFRIQGTASGDRFGAAVAAVGDVNQDGYKDFAVGAYYANPGGRPEAGITYVIFGGIAWGTYPSIGVASLSAAQALRIHGAQSDDWSGDDVDAAGDLNGDGIADFVIGARLASRPNLDYCGEGYVVFGTQQLSLIGVLDLAQLNGQNGFTFRSHQAYAEVGREVVGGGDVNADGRDDLLIAARRADVGTLYDAGEVYVIFGSPTVGASGSMSPASLTGSNGFIIRGQMEDGYLGLFGSPLRDINGDAVADVLVGEFYASPGGLDSAGASYAILGRPGLGAGGVLNIGTLASPQGFVITGAVELELAGAPAAFGDINDDGAVDIAVGASGASPEGLLQAGKIYVLFGDESLGASGQVSLANIGGENGFVIHGADFDDRIGFGMAPIGDVTGDGVDDLAISGISVDAGPNVDAGAVYIIPGIRNPDCDGSGTLDYCEIGDGLMADCNDNHYADFCDVASGHSNDVNQNHVPDECEACVTVPGTGNASGQPTIDLADYTDFASCLGDEVPLFISCSVMDMSGDCVVDLRDFAIFQRQFLD